MTKARPILGGAPKRAGRPSRLPDWQFAAIAKALADPRRYGIVSEIASAPDALPCCALKAAETVSAATISHHIKSLETAGLVEVRDKFAALDLPPRHLGCLPTTALRSLAPPA